MRDRFDEAYDILILQSVKEKGASLRLVPRRLLLVGFASLATGFLFSLLDGGLCLGQSSLPSLVVVEEHGLGGPGVRRGLVIRLASVVDRLTMEDAFFLLHILLDVVTTPRVRCRVVPPEVDAMSLAGDVLTDVPQFTCEVTDARDAQLLVKDEVRLRRQPIRLPRPTTGCCETVDRLTRECLDHRQRLFRVERAFGNGDCVHVFHLLLVCVAD